MTPPTTRLVGVVIGRSPDHRYSVHRGYIDAVVAVGAQPVIVPAGPGVDLARTLELVETCGALILTGGNDVDPLVYGKERGTGEKQPDPDRDGIEVALLHTALLAGIAVLGVCRGIQLLAAGLGGTLIPDLRSAGYDDHALSERESEGVHGISAEPGSVVSRVLRSVDAVNSLHHQAIAVVGPTLRATAWSPDGVIEAVEAAGVLGIQWHPERMFTADARHLGPFEWAVSA